MAPKGGKGGGSSSSSKGGGSSSSCEACNDPLQLIGYDWKNPKRTGLFAIQIIAIIVILACLCLSPRFKWVRQTITRDRLRKSGWLTATGSAIIYYTLSVVDTALQETETVVTNLYYIMYIIIGLFWRLSELVLLAIILRTICESTTSRLGKRLPVLNVAAVVLLGIIAIVAYGLYIAQMSLLIQGNESYYSSYSSYGYVSVAYQVVYFGVSIYAGIIAILAVLKERSKATFLMLCIVCPSLFIRSLVMVIDSAANISPDELSYSAFAGIRWGSSYLYDFMTIALFIGVTVVALIRPQNRAVPQQKVTGYDSVPQPGPYQEPTAYQGAYQQQQYQQPIYQQPMYQQPQQQRTYG